MPEWEGMMEEELGFPTAPTCHVSGTLRNYSMLSLALIVFLLLHENTSADAHICPGPAKLVITETTDSLVVLFFNVFCCIYISACPCGGQCMGLCPLMSSSCFCPWAVAPHAAPEFVFQLVSDLCSFVSAAVDMTKDRCFHHDWQRCHKGWVERHGAQETAMGSELMCFHWCRVGWVPQTIKGNTSWFSNLKSDAFDTCIDWLIIEFGTNTCEFFYTNDKLSLVVFYLIQLQNFKGIW